MKKVLLIALLAGAMASVYAEEAAEADPLQFKGDIRFRLESIDKDGSDTRERGRVRARLQADAKINDELSATIAVASGSEDPVSSNQSFDEGFSSKGINLDQAVLKIKPADGVKIQLGKMKTPFYAANSLIWDGDLRPEGAAISFATGEDIELILNGGAFWVEERSSDDETMLFGGQAVVKAGVVTAGASYYYYDNIDGFAPVFDAEDSFGNDTVDVFDETGTNVTGVVYANGFEILELFAKAGLDVGVPLTIDASIAMNEDADTDDTGYQFGFTVGKANKAGSFEFGYAYREVEANAVLGAFTDSDPYGGGTDGKSHIVKAGYKFTDDLKGAITYFMGEQGLDDGVDYDRIQIDLSSKF